MPSFLVYIYEEESRVYTYFFRQACQIFRRDFIEIGNIEVFLEAYTIASACNKVLRKNFLKPATIGLIPAGGYSGNQNYSKKALMWLLHMGKTDGCRILHARNGREYRLPKLPFYSVDGYCVETRTVYEFFGCFWHGCLCITFRDLPTMAGDTLAERYERTMARIEQIARAGYNVKIQWECKFDESKITKENPRMLTHPIVRHSPLKTRDALYGGQTEAMRLHYKIGENETIDYCDVNSLYPYICKYFKFPIGHPIIYVGETCNNVEASLHIYGLIKCTVVPPRGLYHPVLPYRCNKKLLFCLCRSCVHDQNIIEECHHVAVAERALEVTWVIVEVRLAVEKGYKIFEIHEIYEDQVTQYDATTGQGGLFVEYINTFLKLKAEARGYPSWVRIPDDEDRYIESFWQSEGIRLNKDAIEYNAAKRGSAKLCLNSMWGKFGERTQRAQI
jgi:G:T-mismatch repair DNA endonuclease (very short patch repair protein)